MDKYNIIFLTIMHQKKKKNSSKSERRPQRSVGQNPDGRWKESSVLTTNPASDWLPGCDVATPFMVRFLTLVESICSEFPVRFMSRDGEAVRESSTVIKLHFLTISSAAVDGIFLYLWLGASEMDNGDYQRGRLYDKTRLKVFSEGFEHLHHKSHLIRPKWTVWIYFLPL